jgi:hypothetical protein
MKNYTENNIKTEAVKQIEKIDIRFKFRSEIKKHRRSFGF